MKLWQWLFPKCAHIGKLRFVRQIDNDTNEWFATRLECLDCKRTATRFGQLNSKSSPPEGWGEYLDKALKGSHW